MAEVGGILGGGFGNGSGTAPIGFNDDQIMPEEAEPNVSEEEQAQYDAFVKNAAEIMYTEEGGPEPEVLGRLSTGNKPIDTMAQTLVWLVMLVEQDAKRQGQEIDDGVIFHAAAEILEMLIELSEAAGLHEWKQAEIQGAWYQALDMYREANSDEGGRIDKEEAASAFEALDAADKEGRADEVMPGFSQLMERGMAMAQADQNEVDEDEEPEEGSRIQPNKRGSVIG